jgi:hypothetical protein
MSNRIAPKLLAEFIGTFSFVTLTFNILMGGALTGAPSTRRVRSARWSRPAISAMPGCT